MRHCSTYVIWRSLQPSRPSNIVKILSWRRFSNTSRQSEGVETLLDLLQDTGKDVRNELRWSRIKEQLERRAQIPQNLKVRRPLPLSPLMDPSNIAARQKYKTTKYPGNKDLTPFQRKLAMNPYAQALATPVRMCMVTGARAPAFFLIEFHALNHPKTGAPWFVPDELVQSGVRLIKNHDTIQATGSRAMNVEAVGEDSTLEKDGTSSISSKPSQLPVVRSGAYLLARPEVLHHISKKSRRSAEIFKLAPRRWKDDKSMKTKELVWREDMEDFVRNMLRRTVVAKLKYLESRKAGYIQRDRNGFDEIEKIQRLGAVLWLGPPPIRKARYTSEVTDQDSERGPPPLAMANYRGRYVPIYNLRTMLGIELVQALREHSGVFEGEIVMIKAKANTVRTQMILWKLQLYMTTSDSSGEFT